MSTEIIDNQTKSYLLSVDELERIQNYIEDLEDEIDILNNINDKEITVDLNELRNQIQRKGINSI